MLQYVANVLRQAFSFVQQMATKTIDIDKCKVLTEAQQTT